MRVSTLVTLLSLFAVNASALGDCPPPPNCPIVINFGNGPYRLTGAESPVQFDFFGNGQPVRMGWTAAGSEAAFLGLDRNWNGLIDNGAELFGNVTPLDDGSKAKNGFVALAQFDENRDGIVDYHDQIWSELLLWRDVNHDAVSQMDEIARVADSDLAAIGLDYHWTGRVDQSENEFRYQSKVWIAEGKKHPTPRPVYDIFFVPVP